MHWHESVICNAPHIRTTVHVQQHSYPCLQLLQQHAYATAHIPHVSDQRITLHEQNYTRVQSNMCMRSACTPYTALAAQDEDQHSLGVSWASSDVCDASDAMSTRRSRGMMSRDSADWGQTSAVAEGCFVCLPAPWGPQVTHGGGGMVPSRRPCAAVQRCSGAAVQRCSGAAVQHCSGSLATGSAAEHVGRRDASYRAVTGLRALSADSAW